MEAYVYWRQEIAARAQIDEWMNTQTKDDKPLLGALRAIPQAYSKASIDAQMARMHHHEQTGKNR